MTDAVQQVIRNLSFGDYCRQKNINGMLRTAFEMHMKLDGGFSPRSERQWDVKRTEFLSQNRGRRG